MDTTYKQHNKPFLSVEIYGAGSPVVLVHGWGFDGRVWRDYVPVLSQSYQVFVVDLPCFGRSDCVMDFEAMLEILVLHLPTDALWVGWSLGGLIAQQMIVRGVARQAISIAAPPAFVEKPNFVSAMSEETFEGFYRAVERNSNLGQKLFLRLVEQGGASSMISLMDFGTAALETLNWLKTVDMSHSQAVMDNTQYVLSKNDALVPVASAEMLLARGADVTLVEGGHAVVLDQMAKIMNIIQQSRATLV